MRVTTTVRKTPEVSVVGSPEAAPVNVGAYLSVTRTVSIVWLPCELKGFILGEVPWFSIVEVVIVCMELPLPTAPVVWKDQSKLELWLDQR